MKNKIRILVLILSVLCCCMMFACNEKDDLIQGGNSVTDTSYNDNNDLIQEGSSVTDTPYNVVFKLKTEDYSLTYNASTNDVIKRISDGEALGNDFLVLDSDGEIQNQEYKVLGWYYYDKNGNEKSIDENTIISVETLNIKENLREIVLYARVKKLWL